MGRRIAALLIAIGVILGGTGLARADSPPPLEANRVAIENQLNRELANSICGEDPGPRPSEKAKAYVNWYQDGYEDSYGVIARTENPTSLQQFTMDYAGEGRWVQGMNLQSGGKAIFREAHVCTAAINLTADNQLYIRDVQQFLLTAKTRDYLYAGFNGHWLKIGPAKHSPAANFGVSYDPESDRFVLRTIGWFRFKP